MIIIIIIIIFLFKQVEAKLDASVSGAVTAGFDFSQRVSMGVEYRKSTDQFSRFLTLSSQRNWHPVVATFR
jgi:hypothetical protein